MEGTRSIGLVVLLLSCILEGWFAMQWMLMIKHTLRLHNLQSFLDGEQIWSPLVELYFPAINQVKTRYLGCRQVLSTLYFIRWKFLQKSLGVCEDEVAGLFRRTSCRGTTTDSFQISLVWQ